MRLSRKQITFLGYLLVVALGAIYMKVLDRRGLYNTALLYIFLPYCVSVAITLLRSPHKPQTLWQSYRSHVATAVTIFFSTSLLVGEGFICILFFAPIYLIAVSFVYGCRSFARRNKHYAVVLPAVIVVMSMEGVTPALSFSRDNVVEVSATTVLTPAQIRSQLMQPFNLEQERHWLLSIFPMPYLVEAESLEQGDIHRVYTRYHRWFVTNTHEGVAEFLLEEVSENYIRTKVIKDTTYFANYLHGAGTEIYLNPISAGRTEVVLTLHYRRALDPAWYFHPLQRYGVRKMGELIVQELILKAEHND